MIYFAAQLADHMTNGIIENDQAKYEEWDDKLGFFTPILKGFLTEMGLESANLGIQVFGGHGYIKEHGMEQIARDARISTLYEGTTGIQALDLLGRKVLLQTRGKAVREFTGQIAKFAVDNLRDARLRNFGMTLGVRDTRKIDAAYNMTEHDVREQARFDDSIGIFPEFIDGYGILILPTTGRYFAMPYRNLLPKGVGNLLVAGRSSGGDRVSHAATRNMACCAVLGQGAGIAAALSVKHGQSLDAVDVGAVQAELDRQGVRYH